MTDKEILSKRNTFRRTHITTRKRLFANEQIRQGSPLSPLLSNIVLGELDKELENRGHCFVRYADDFVIFVRSRKAGERVKQSIGNI